MNHSPAERYRRLICGVCMIAAPLALFVSDLVWPVTHTKAKDVMADATGSTGRIYAGALLCVLAMMLFAGAIIGLAHMLHERRPGIAFAGGAMAIVGVVAVSAIVGWMGLFLSEAAKSGRDSAGMTALLDDMMSKMVPFGVASMLIGVGFLVLAYGLWSTRVVPMWSAALIALAAIGLDIGNPASLKPLVVAADAVLFVGLGVVGLTVLSETEEEWEHTPEFHGITRPVLA